MSQTVTHPVDQQPVDLSQYKPPRIKLNVTGKKAAWLRAYGDGLSFRQVKKLTGVHPTQHARWLKSDPDYAADFASIKVLRDGYLEDSMYARACKSDTIAGIFLLKASDPARFSDRHVNVNETSVNISIDDARAQLSAMVEQNPALRQELLRAMNKRALDVVAVSDAAPVASPVSDAAPATDTAQARDGVAPPIDSDARE